MLTVQIPSPLVPLGNAGPLWAVLAVLLLPAGAGAAEPVAKSNQTIHVGIYVNQVPSLSIKTNTFEVDFIVWFRGQTDDFDPLETFGITHGQILSKSEVTKSTLPGGVHYASCRVIARITHLWDVTRFPQDDHTLVIGLEDGSYEEPRVRYMPDTENCAVSPHLEVPGWTVGAPDVAVQPHHYNTNYGDTSLPSGHASTYSQLVCSIPLARPSWGYFVKLFSGLFVATAIAFLAFCIRPGDARFGLGAGAIFAAAASQYITSSHLPETHLLTMADVLHIVAFVFIFLALAESALALFLYNAGRVRASRRLDWGSLLVLGGAYAGLSLWVARCWGLG